jgi:hypothetical protein
MQESIVVAEEQQRRRESFSDRSPSTDAHRVPVYLSPFVRHQPARVIKEISRRPTCAHRATFVKLFAKKETERHDRQHLPIDACCYGESTKYLEMHYATVSRLVRKAEGTKI